MIAYAKNPKDSYFGEGGDLFILPINAEQQQKLLKLSDLGGLRFDASLPKSLTTNARVIDDVPISVSEEDLFEDFEKYKVSSLQRLYRRNPDGSSTPL